jgi:peptidylprolyl isomerase
MELVSITKGPKPEPAPSDVAAAPADAVKTKSGIAYKVLKPGTGAEKPNYWDRVTLQFTGWHAGDGKMIETTKHRQTPTMIIVDKKMPAFEEMLTGMVAGEQRRVWIPADQATVQTPGKQPGPPPGPVTYDIELVSVQKGQAPVPAPADVAEVPKDAQKSKTGLAWKVIKKGTGNEKPSQDATVEIHYTGWTTNGKMFDSSVQRKAPARFPLKNHTKGFVEGIGLMTKGETRRFWIPAELAYQNQPGKPTGMLVVEIELISFVEPPPTPPDVAAPPADAEKTASGLASKVLQKGSGEKPAADSLVEVQYSAWTSSDGKLFDSTVLRGRASKMPLGRMQLPGLKEGILLMSVGEKRRLWIPEELAYKGRPGPKGMVVYDVELVSVGPAPQPGQPGQPGGQPQPMPPGHPGVQPR